ncbi:MAG: RsmE family RNA methyltransferase [Saprospiraceae bacterium]
MGVNALHWYYLPLLGDTGEQASLTGDEWHHCFHVLRLEEGDDILVTDGKGKCFQGMIKTASKHEGWISLTHDLKADFHNSRKYKVNIGIAPTKNIDRTELAIEKLVEIGVDEICFLDCKHSERHHLRIDRMEKIMIAAAKQSRKINFPSLFDLTSPEKYAERKRNDQVDVNILCCHLDGETKSISENYLPGQDVVILIGPEGGFAKQEIEALKTLNAKMTKLGPFRLRVETAAITACADIHLLNELNYKK